MIDLLYISRRVGETRFGVVDTDDMTEEVVDYRTLNDIIGMGMSIEGVSSYDKKLHGRTVKAVARVEVYQNRAYATTRQTKARVLQGVDIRTSGDEVTYFAWDENLVKPGTVVRLSDYGVKCGDTIFDIDCYHNGGQLTVVLDDKIRFRSKTFYGAARSGVIFDIREVTKERVVKWLYGEWMTRGGSLDLPKFIIDHQDRQDNYAAVAVVVTGFNAGAKQIPDAAAAFAENVFYEEFKKLADSVFQYPGYMEAREYAREHIGKVKRNLYFWRSMCQDYERVRNEDELNVFVALSKATTCNTGYIQHFSNYMYHFTPSAKVQELYVTLCNRANNWFLDLAKSKHWVVS